MLAFRSVVSVLVSFVRSFSTPSRPALRAASGRLRPGNDTTVTGEPASPFRQGNRYRHRILGCSWSPAVRQMERLADPTSAARPPHRSKPGDARRPLAQRLKST